MEFSREKGNRKAQALRHRRRNRAKIAAYMRAYMGRRRAAK